MKQKYGLLIATWILWFASILIPLLYSALKSIPRRWMTLLLLVTMLLSLAVLFQWVFLRRSERQHMENFHGEIEAAGMTALQHMTAPVLLAAHSGEILWYNETFRMRFTPSRNVLGQYVQDVIHLNLAALDHSRDLLMEHNGLSYRVHATSSVQNQREVVAVQFTEITDILRLQNENTNSRPCVMLLVIDSYDDLLQYARESEKAQVSAEVERVLERFMQGTDGVIRKVENDLFYAVMESRHLHQIMNNRFHVLDEARQIRVNDRMHITFSIGVGDGASSLAESEKFARQSLDMALGRGGDQAAVNTENGFCFFGGASKGVEKKSKTKIRSIALAMQELIENSDQVFLMGHRFGDLDSIGSACGLAGAVRLMRKPAYVVVSRQSCLATQLIDRMEQFEDGPRFMEPREALGQITDNSLLIIVDTHNKDILESAELYQAARYVIVIDHQSGDVIPLSEVNDQTFATGLLGQGVAIQPTGTRVIAPADAKVEAIFPTGHAVALNTVDGLDVLIHVGLDTVQLEGKHFTVHAQVGDVVHKGDVLIEFDREAIAAEGYDVTVPILVCNSVEFSSIKGSVGVHVEEMDQLIVARER